MMFVIICILLFTSQCNGCLDLLVRCFNEVFSPIIEVGDSRREISHDVDDITYFYKRDKNGAFILDESELQAANPQIRKLENQNNLLGSLFSQLRSSSSGRSASDEPVSCHHSKDDTNEAPTEPENQPSEEFVEPQFPEVFRTTLEPGNDSSLPGEDFDYPLEENNYQNNDIDDDESFEFDFGYNKKNHPHKSNYYVPGRRPLADFFIKILEWFQLTDKSKFITSRPRYRSSQFSPYTDDNYKR